MMLSDSQFDAAAQSVAQPDTDPIDRAAQQVAGDQKTQLRASLYSSLMANPDMAARAQRLGRKTGIPGDVVERNLPEVERSAALTDIDRALEGSPLLAQWMADPKNARVSHDDVPQMGAIEAAVKWLVSAPDAPSTLGGSLRSAYHGASAGSAGAFQAVAGTAAPLLDFLEPVQGIGGNPLRRLQEGFGLIAQDALASQKAARGKSATWLGSAVDSGVESLAQNAGFLPLALLPGGQAAALTGMSAMAGGQTYTQDIQKGQGHWTAAMHGASDALIEGWTERFALGRLIGEVKAGAPLFQTLLKNAALEVPGEQAATALQDLNEWAVNNNGRTFGDYLRERPEAAAQTLIATLVGVGGNVAIMKGVQGVADRAAGTERRAQLAEQHGQALADVSKLIEASKLRQRDPEAFATFAQSLTEEGVSSLYVDVRALQQSGVDLQALAQAMPSVAQQIEQAAATGGDVVIPTAEFLTQAPGQEWSAALIDHARTGADAMSPAGAREYMQAHGEQLQEEIARTIEQHATDTEWQAGRDAVRADFQRQLDEVGRWQPEVNRQYAALLGDYYAATAARAGTTPQELAARYPLRIQAKAGQGATLEQDGRAERAHARLLRKRAERETDAGKAGALVAKADALDAQAARWEAEIAAQPDATDGAFARDGDGRHKAPGPHNGVSLDAYAGDTEGDGLPGDAESLAALRAARGNPDADVTVYRAAPVGSVIRPGDWVSGSRTYAEQHGAATMGAGNFRIIEQVVKARDLFTDGNSVNEWGYAPGKVLEQSALPPSVEVDGVRRSTQNSKGQPIHPTEEGVRNFWRWFGDSKVVDEQGRPLVVYHGTTAAVSAFSETLFGTTDHGTVGVGIYASSAPAVANAYAKKYVPGLGLETAGGNVMPLFLSIRNPIGFDEAMRIKKEIASQPGTTEKNIGRLLTTELKSRGYDGVSPTEGEWLGVGESWTAFAPSQIKSATGNRGTFDPADASILNQSARGQISFGHDITQAPSVISLFDGADFSTLIHEAGHFFLEAHMDLAARIAGRISDGEQVSDGERGIVADANALLGWFGVKGDESAGGAAGGALDQPAYHGTPHRGIDKFSTDKIGTGEGAQAYGWGLYFASKREIAEWYREKLAGESVASVEVEEYTIAGDRNWIVTRYDVGGGRIDRSGYLEDSELRELLGDEVAGEILAKADVAPGDADGEYSVELVPGQLYEVEIPEDSDMLLWDKPLSEQPDAVRAKAARVFKKYVEPTVEVYWTLDGQRLDTNSSDFSLVQKIASQGYDAVLADAKARVESRASRSVGDPLRKAADAALARVEALAGREVEQITRNLEVFESDVTGKALYSGMERSLGSDKAASEALAALGIKGIKYLDGTSRNAGDGTFNYVIFSGDDVAIKNTFYQGVDQLDARPEPPTIGRTPLETWAMMSIDQKRAFHEQFARGFELYALEGKAPSLSLQSVFQRFSAWLKSVYRSITQRSAEDVLQVTLTDEVRQVMDRMIATDEQIAEAQAMREMGPLFGGADQAGMTPEQWAQYHELAAQATAQASEQLQARGLRDMQWLRNARSRELKRLQDRAAGLRREVEIEVRREVLSTPLYRAWQFLTTKGDAQATAQPTPRVRASGALDNTRDNLFTAIAKLGGLDRAEVVGAWGVDPKDRLESGVFGAPVLRKEGGLSIDAMAERLVEEGYLLPDENGRADVADLETAFDSQRRGVDQFSTWHDYAERARVAQGEDAPEALPDEILHGKLDTAVLRDMYGTQPEAIWRTLSTRRMTSEASGIHPEVVAETFGFDSGDALVRALVAADPPRQVIEGMTDQRMLERYGDLATPEGLQRAADESIHNEARARAIATELDALEKMGRVREPAGGRATADVLAKAARDYALAVIGAKKVRDIRPGEYTAAEARASKAAQKAFKAGDTQAAATEKRHQLIQHAAAKAALQAREEVEKAVEYLRRMAKRPKGLDAGYADQIDQLLERFDLKAVSNKELDKRSGLAAWVESQRDQGMEPDIAPELLNEAARTSWRNLTLDELRGLRDAVKQIEHLGRLKGKLLASKAKRDFEVVRDELADSIDTHARGRTADTRTPATVLGRRLAAIKRFGAAHIKAATWARIFDGGRDGGPVWEYLIRGANVAGDFETTRRAQATEALTKILAPVMKSSKLHRKAQYASVNRSLTREQVLVMALNTGNDGNWQRMLDGEGWTRPQVMAVLNTLTATEWQAVQGVWDHMESYRPEIGAKERRVYGKEPEWVQAVPLLVDTADGQRLTLRGGYFPIKYDPAANAQAEQHADAEDAKQMMRGAYTSATTRRGFTKSRVQEVKGRPLMYSLGAVYGGVQDVIHDLAWHEWLIDTNKLLRSAKVDSAIRQHYGPEVVRQFKEWVRDVAAGDRPQQAAADEVLSRIRRGVSMAGLGFNVMSAAMQPLGLTQSIVRVGVPWVARGVAQYVANPLAATRRVVAASDFMAGRSRTRFRELNELRNQVEGESGAMQWVNRNAFWLMLRAQQAVDVPTWLGAYEKAISDGSDDARAVALADQAVLDAQGGGQVKDQAGIERGGPAQKLFTVFYSFMNTALNAGVGQVMTADTRAKKAKLAVDLLLLYTVPAVLGAMLKDALTPGDSGDDEPEELAKKLAAAQIDYLMGLFMLVRETTESVKIVTGLTDRPRDYSGPAGLRLIPDAVAFAKQAGQGELDDAFRKAAVNLTGDLFGLPAAQVNRTITGAKALADDDTDNPAALVFGFQKDR